MTETRELKDLELAEIIGDLNRLVTDHLRDHPKVSPEIVKNYVSRLLQERGIIQISAEQVEKIGERYFELKEGKLDEALGLAKDTINQSTEMALKKLDGLEHEVEVLKPTIKELKDISNRVGENLGKVRATAITAKDRVQDTGNTAIENIEAKVNDSLTSAELKLDSKIEEASRIKEAVSSYTQRAEDAAINAELDLQPYIDRVTREAEKAERRIENAAQTAETIVYHQGGIFGKLGLRGYIASLVVAAAAAFAGVSQLSCDPKTYQTRIHPSTEYKTEDEWDTAIHGRHVRDKYNKFWKWSPALEEIAEQNKRKP